MATDRMSDLDSNREGTDRMGQTVILGNAIDSGPVSIEAGIIVAATVGESNASSNMNMAASITGNLTNGSFGIWAVDFVGAAAALLSNEGAAVAGVPFNAITQGLMTWGADGMLLNIQVFTATAGYTPTSGTAQIVVHAIGAGGGGGGCSTTTANNSAGAGGGAGAAGLARITSGFSGQTVTIGAGGTGGAAGNNAGTAGGDSSFGTLLIAGGGSGGAGDTAGGIPRASAGAAGGSASGSSSLFGARGQRGAGGHAENTSASWGGAGGTSQYGDAIPQLITAGANPGQNANGFGAGGGGAAAAGTNTGQAGGNGAPGLVIIYEYNA